MKEWSLSFGSIADFYIAFPSLNSFRWRHNLVVFFFLPSFGSEKTDHHTEHIKSSSPIVCFLRPVRSTDSQNLP